MNDHWLQERPFPKLLIVWDLKFRPQYLLYVISCIQKMFMALQLVYEPISRLFGDTNFAIVRII